MITLTAGDVGLGLLPEVGGSVARFTYQGHDLLRSTPAGASNALQAACFPLVPFANRIAHGVFRWGDREIRLLRNFGDHPHTLHGHGWQQPWAIKEKSQSCITLAFSHTADAWPWSYDAAQVFTLTAQGLRIELSLRNTGDRPMPASIGLHPYFPKTPVATLTADVKTVWLTDENCIPTYSGRAAYLQDIAAGAAVAGLPFIDHCHSGWTGQAMIGGLAPGITLDIGVSDTLRVLHLYVPVGENFFCVEPVSAMPDAVNRAEPVSETGLQILAPNEKISGWMNLSVRRA